MNIFTPFKKIWNNIQQYFVVYVQSIVFLRVIQIVVALPAISYLFLQILKVTGLSSITENTLFEVFRHPLGIFALTLLAIIVIFFIYYEQAYYFILAFFQRTGEPYDFKKIIRKLNRKARFFLSLQSLLFLLYFLLILPIASIGMSPGLAKNLYIPHFIIDELVKFPGGLQVYVASLILVFYLSLRLLYAVPFFVLEENMTILQGVKKSWIMTRRKTIRNISYLAVIILGYGLAMAALSFLILLPLFAVERWFPTAAPMMAGLTLTTLQLVLFLSFGVLQAILADTLLGLAYPELNTLERRTEENKSLFPVMFSRGLYLIAVGMFVFTVIGNTASVTKILYQPSTQIIAHRGYTAEGVENTISALRAAKKANADYVEMDILQTKDRQFVVIHDTNLERLAGRNENVSELTLAELQEIDVSANGFTDKIPSLEEYIAVAKEIDMKLVIEMKYHGNESEDMEQLLVELLQKEGVAQDYLVQSLEERAIAKVKEIDPDITTGYLVALNIGNLPQTRADFVVIEEFSLNQRLIDQARDAGKGIGVWTVNQEQIIRRALRLNVDGLITNEPSRAYGLRAAFNQEQTFVQRVQDLLE